MEFGGGSGQNESGFAVWGTHAGWSEAYIRPVEEEADEEQEEDKPRTCHTPSRILHFADV